MSSYLSDYASTTVHSPSTLTINLKTPDAFFLGRLSKIYILNSKLVQENAGTDNGQGWLANHDAGSGPYTLGAMNTLSDITVNRWADYWNFDPTRPSSIRDLEVDQELDRSRRPARRHGRSGPETDVGGRSGHRQ